MNALLVVDIQKGLTIGKKLWLVDLFIETVNAAIRAMRETNGIVISIQHNNKQLIKDSQDWNLDERIELCDSDYNVQKEHGNAFEATELDSILRSNGVDSVYVCGLVTHGCVRSTCIGSIDSSFKTFLVAKGHTNWNKDAKSKIDAMEKELGEMGVILTDVTHIKNAQKSGV